MDYHIKYVICGKDCNKHESRVFACFDSFDACIKYLNKKGIELTDNTEFDIKTHEIGEEEQLLSMFNFTFEHVELFKHLYEIGGTGPYCTHKGKIHIACIDRDQDFSGIYESLDETYM